MLNELRYEVRDVLSNKKEPLLEFIGVNKFLSKDDIQLILLDLGIKEDEIDKLIDLLLWFSFLGVKKSEEEYYSYNFVYNIAKQKLLIKNEAPTSMCYCIHPAFRISLNI